MSKDNNEVLEITISPIKKRFYSNDNNYGIYIAKLERDSKDYDVISVEDITSEIILVGTMPELEFGVTYDAQVTEKNHPKFGLQYETKIIYEKMFSSRKQQVVFLETILTENQVSTISDSYPQGNLIEMFKNDEIDHKLLHGIGEKTLEKIKNKIKANEKYQNALIELTGVYGIPYSAVIRLSDKYGSPDVLLNKVKENPYLLTQIDGFGFKKVDEIALSMGIEKNSKNRIVSCIEYLLNEEGGNGHVWVKSTNIISKAVKLLDLRISEVQGILNEELENEKSEIKETDGRLFLENNLVHELGIYLHLKRLLHEKPVISMDFDINEAISEVEKMQGFEFTDEQRKAIEYGIKYNVLVVVGKAGAGKTAVIKGIVNVLKKHQDSLVKENPNTLPLSYATCALSGKASQRIRESTGLDSFTIHRLLGFNPFGGWTYDESNKLPHSVIVLDEGSMVNSQLAHYLIRAIESGAKLIVTGDIAQLEPIGTGNFLVDLLNNKDIPHVELTKVHRQAQASGILYNANLVRDGIHFVKKTDKAQRMGELKDLYYHPYNNKENVLKKVLEISNKYNGDILDFQVLAPMKSRGELSTSNLNKELQLIFNKDPEDVDDHKKITKKKNVMKGDEIIERGTFLLEGDKVIINGNNYEKDVFNGTMGIIEYIDKKGDGEIIIDFEDVGRITFKNNDMKQIELGYAITIHKSQGSQWKFVVLAFDNSSYIMLNRQMLYTGKTRAEKALFLIVEVKALFQAIDTDKSSKRNTFLSDLLNGKDYIMSYVADMIESYSNKNNNTDIDEEKTLELI